MVIYNPVSGSGEAEEISAIAEHQLTRSGWTTERCATREPNGARRLAAGLPGSIDYVIVVGGDGTIRETLEGFGRASDQLQLGIVPVGHANVVARELGIPRQPARAIESLLRGTPVPVDLAEANGETCVAMVGVGFDARAVDYVTRLRTSAVGTHWYRQWGDSLYLAAGVASALQSRHLRLRLTLDGTTSQPRYASTVLCNFRTYAKGWSMAPEAHFQSGQLHFQARTRPGIIAVGWQTFAAMLRTRSPRFIAEYGTCSEVLLESDRPFPYQIDGDFRGDVQRLEVRIRPQAARIVVPTLAHAIEASASDTRPGLNAGIRTTDAR
ncbi:hypothetical protein MK489_20005 [Myxococcota bacterium]|nr:hypothetical protein [Myxococcota bacterium]